jgi:flavin reductase (DIM6/NTAB) family NADH-FMN oxidoreductase RutF
MIPCAIKYRFKRSIQTTGTITNMDALTHDRFKAALGRFATGVTIVTTVDAAGQPVGLTANSFNSVSLAPPLVLWSLSGQSASMPAFADCTHYAIHVLGAHQRDLAQRFATKGVDRWADTPHTPGPGGVPLIDGAIATLVCTNRSRYPEGDHTIFVGEVHHCSHQPQLRPLLYHGGRFYTEHPL